MTLAFQFVVFIFLFYYKICTHIFVMAYNNNNVCYLYLLCCVVVVSCCVVILLCCVCVLVVLWLCCSVALWLFCGYRSVVVVLCDTLTLVL